MIFFVHVETSVSQQSLLSPWGDALRWRRCWAHATTWRKPWVTTARCMAIPHNGEHQEAWRGSRGFPREGAIKHKCYYHRGLIYRVHDEENCPIIDHLKTRHSLTYRSRPQRKTMEQNRQWGISSRPCSWEKKRYFFIVSGSIIKIYLYMCMHMCTYVSMYLYSYFYIYLYI